MIIPTGAAADTCRAWSGVIADVIPSAIDLRRPDMIPHVSLYNTAYPDGAENTLLKTLTAFARTQRPFNVRLTKKAIVHGYVFMNAEISPEIDAIHRALIEAFDPVRAGAFNTFELELKLSPEELDRLKRTGMILSLEAFLPHVTIARPTDESRVEEAIGLVPDPALSFTADAIHLVETGPNGTCKKIVASFPFGV